MAVSKRASKSKAASSKTTKRKTKPSIAATEIADVPYLSQPALSSDGRLLCFTYSSDIWLVETNGGQARQITSNIQRDAMASFSPDDKQIAFISQRSGSQNIYIAEIGSSQLPRRLTYHTASGGPLSWSRNGKWIYFGSNLDRQSRGIYKISSAGSTPIRLIADPQEGYSDQAISPDGKKLIFHSDGDAWWRCGPNPAMASHLWLLDEPSGKIEKKLTSYEGVNIRPMWERNGKGLYFLSDRSGRENIWYMTVNGDARARQITHFIDGRVIRPSISRDGKWIVFERDFQIWLLNVAEGSSRPIDIILQADEKINSRRTHFIPGSIGGLRLSGDNKKVAFTAFGQIFADLAEKGASVDKKGEAFRVSKTEARHRQIFWHPNNKQIVYISDHDGHDEVYRYDFEKREETRLTNSVEDKYTPKYSPDGKWLAYGSGKKDIYLMNTSSGKHNRFVKNQRFLRVVIPTEFHWSPDSKWLAFTASNADAFENIYLQKIRTRKSRQLTFLNNLHSRCVQWAPNGKFLIFVTGHYRSEGQIVRVNLKPIPPRFYEEDFDKLFASEEAKTEKKQDAAKNEKKPVAKEAEQVDIQFSGIKRRVQYLSKPSHYAIPLAIRPDSKMLIFHARLSYEPYLWSMSLEEDKRGDAPRAILKARDYSGGLVWSADGKKVFFLRRGIINTFGLNDDGSPKGTPKEVPVKGEVELDYQRLKLQAFDEGWRMLRDYFYDPDFHGCDWNAMYSRFLPAVKGARTRRDFHDILNMMVGELNASHLGASGRGFGQRNIDSFIGLDFERTPLEKKGQFKIKHVVADSPVTHAEKPPQKGEFLLAIDGRKVDGRTENLIENLQKRDGKRVTLLVNSSPRKKGAREIKVQPVRSYRLANLRYREWVMTNADYVSKKSKNRLGYVHIPVMSHNAFMNLIADLDAEAYEREGVILDVRFNGGGHIASFILDFLSRKQYAYSGYRNVVRTSDANFAGDRILNKPIILVTNEHSYSNAEMFSEGFRRLGLGKIVGRPTAGAVIWTFGVRLSDGTSFRIPRGYVHTMDGENIELVGRPVDVFADRPPGESDRGIDSQLDVAVAELLRDIDAKT
ncbi:MAG: S41 family peptidase [Calditrichia bacterium]